MHHNTKQKGILLRYLTAIYANAMIMIYKQSFVISIYFIMQFNCFILKRNIDFETSFWQYSQRQLMESPKAL